MVVLGLVLVPVLVAVLIVLLGSRLSRQVALAGTLAELLLGGYAFCLMTRVATDTSVLPLINFHTDWLPRLGSDFHLQIDGINIVLVLLTVLLLPFIILTSFNREIRSPKAFYTLILLMQSALVGVFVARDAFLFYIFWELALIPVYFICLLWGGEGRQRITFKFFIYTLTGSLFMLLGLIYLVAHTPTISFDMQAIYEAGRSLSLKEQMLVFGAMYLAFAIKIPIFPLHTWQPDTYVNAPTQGTMLLSGIMLKMGTFALIRWLIPVVPMAWAELSHWVVLLSVISVVYGSLMAITQKDFKRLLAYSSMAHVGLIAAGIFSWNLQGVQGGLFQMLSHGINVVGLFFICDIIQQRMKTDHMSSLGGIRMVSPLFGVLFIVVLLGSVALPLTNGFVGEFMLLHGVFQYQAVFAAFAGLTVILGAVYMLRAYHIMMHGDSNELTASFGELAKSEMIVLAGLTVLIIAFGIYPKIILDVTEPAVRELVDYVNTVTKL
jgi:NADH-quinone oxidoreductase subunit M